MYKIMTGVLALLLLTGCTATKPGGFERVDEDEHSHTVQYRYHPQTFNRDAMQADLSEYCSERGFDKVEALPAQDRHIPGLKKVWFQCNYALNG